VSVAGEVAIVGTGMTKFGENFTQSYFDLATEAALEALADAGIEPTDVDAAWLGTCYAYAYGTEGNAGTSLAEPLRLYPIPVTRVANYCATGLDALRNAAFAVAAGEHRRVLVVGVEKMRDVEPRGSLVAQHVERGHPLYCKGRTAPGIFGLIATRYREVYGDPKEAMARVAVKNHRNGALNPKAHFQSEVTLEQVLGAPMVAEPIGLLDCCPTTDGAAAVVLVRASEARELRRDPVILRGLALSVTSGYFSTQFDPHWDFLGFPSTREAARRAYAQAGIQDPRREIDFAEVHDCFTITELVNYEDLGFCEPGEAPTLVREGITSLEGAFPVNASGGLKSFGHPIGATGLRMVCEIADQLRGRCGPRQIRRARTGLAHNLGGPGSVAAVAILGLE
jgi:acetyl-CoA C-acetyltransferase